MAIEPSEESMKKAWDLRTRWGKDVALALDAAYARGLEDAAKFLDAERLLRLERAVVVRRRGDDADADDDLSAAGLMEDLAQKIRERKGGAK